MAAITSASVIYVPMIAASQVCAGEEGSEAGAVWPEGRRSRLEGVDDEAGHGVIHELFGVLHEGDARLAALRAARRVVVRADAPPLLDADLAEHRRLLRVYARGEPAGPAEGVARDRRAHGGISGGCVRRATLLPQMYP